MQQLRSQALLRQALTRKINLHLLTVCRRTTQAGGARRQTTVTIAVPKQVTTVVNEPKQVTQTVLEPRRVSRTVVEGGQVERLYCYVLNSLTRI